jgi:hypothetical protein
MAFAVGHISGHFNPAVTWACGPAAVSGERRSLAILSLRWSAELLPRRCCVVASGKAGFDAAASGLPPTAMANTPGRLLHAVGYRH